MKLLNKENIFQFIKFSIVGVSNTLLGLGLYYLFLWLGMNYLLANFFSWFIGTFNAFYWNNKFVFDSNSRWVIILLRTYISYGGTLFLSTVLLYIYVDFFAISNKLAPILVLLITVPLNFLLNKFWAFKGKKNEKN